MKRREIVVLAAVVAKLGDKAESELGWTNTWNGSSWYSNCQLLFWYDSNELWKNVEKPADIMRPRWKRVLLGLVVVQVVMQLIPVRRESGGGCTD